MRFCLILALPGLMFTTGCATSGGSIRVSDAEFRQLVKEYNDDAPEHEQVVCEKVDSTGSHYRKWQCRKKSSKLREEIKAQDLIKRIRRMGSPRIKGG